MRKEALIIITLVCLLIGPCLLCFPCATSAGVLTVNDYHGIPYVSGGIGFDEREELTKARADYNLKLVFAMRSTAYLSDVVVIIEDNGGKTVFEAVTEGPWLLANLPAGSYIVKATMLGKTLNKNTNVKKGGHSELSFFWED